MSAVMVNDEQSHQKPGCQHRQRHHQPIGHRQTDVHQIPESCIRNQRVNDLPDAPSNRWLLVSGHNLFPGGIVWPACICRRNWIIFIHHESRSSFWGLIKRWRAKSGTATSKRTYVHVEATARLKDRNLQACRGVFKNGGPRRKSPSGAATTESTRIPRHGACFPLSWGERAGTRASVSSNLIFGVGGGFWREKQFRLVTSTAPALATILELTLSRQRLGLRRMSCQFWKHRTRLAA